MIRLLAGDIGGTNARLVLYETAAISDSLGGNDILSGHTAVSQVYYKNNDFNSFTEVLSAFLSIEDNSKPIQAACFAVAGPVTNNRINFTNREGWIIDAAEIQDEFPIESVQLVNDFVANGYGLLALGESDFVTLQEGKKAPGMPIALVGAGTGLGECFLAPGPGGSYVAYPSEGGHVEFAPKSNLEEELLHFIQEKVRSPTDNPKPDGDKPRVSVERVVSGGGLENIYEFLRSKYPQEVDRIRDEEIMASNEKGALISKLNYDYKLCKLALELMFKIYGSEVGNVALKYMPLGGLYVAGGIAPKNLEFITSPGAQFMRSFWDKGRVQTIMSDFPVHVVMKEDLGLRGAHVVASRMAAQLGSKRQSKASSSMSGARPTAVGEAMNSLSNLVASYPLTWALASTVSSALTAAAIVCVGYLMKFSVQKGNK